MGAYVVSSLEFWENLNLELFLQWYYQSEQKIATWHFGRNFCFRHSSLSLKNLSSLGSSRRILQPAHAILVNFWSHATGTRFAYDSGVFTVLNFERWLCWADVRWSYDGVDISRAATSPLLIMSIFSSNNMSRCLIVNPARFFFCPIEAKTSTISSDDRLRFF